MNDNLNYILIDSTRLTSLQICPQKFKYSFIDNLRSIEGKDYFEIGSLYHLMLKTHYAILKYRSRWPVEFSYDKLVEICIKILEHFAVRGKIPLEEIQKIEHIWRQYTDYYRDDDYLAESNILFLEQYFAKPLLKPFEYSGKYYQVILEGIIDLAYKDSSGLLIVVEHKHQSVKSPFANTRNQFLLYPWATDSLNLTINIIGTQKTVSPEKKFYRTSFSYTKDMIEEFEQDTLYFAKQYLEYRTTNFWPKNRNSCDTYGLCEFQMVCGVPAELRPVRLERDYVKYEWNAFKR